MTKANTFYYLTQYDTVGMSDTDIIKTLEANTKDIDTPELDELLELVPELADKYACIIYNAIMANELDDDNIGDFIEVFELVANEDGDALLDLIDECTIDDLFSDGTLEDMADDDLRNNGINAQALYWYEDIRADTLHEFNGYCNGFYYYDNVFEYLDQNELYDKIADYLGIC